MYNPLPPLCKGRWCGNPPRRGCQRLKLIKKLIHFIGYLMHFKSIICKQASVTDNPSAALRCQRLGCRLGRCFCFAEVSAGRQHPRQREALVCAVTVILYVRHPPYLKFTKSNAANPHSIFSTSANFLRQRIKSHIPTRLSSIKSFCLSKLPSYLSQFKG